MQISLISFILIFINIFGCNTFIIPDEIPSLLSVIYSNIPTIKKGTDSRIGWGFRLGDRADFQFLVELGPQTNTQPLGNQPATNTNSKRNTLNNLANTLYAKRQQEKKQQQRQENEENTTGGSWLENWSKQVAPPKETVEPKPGLAIGEIDAKSVLPDDDELEQIEKVQQKRRKGIKVVTVTSTTTLKPSTTTSDKDALNNVEIED